MSPDCIKAQIPIFTHTTEVQVSLRTLPQRSSPPTQVKLLKALPEVKLLHMRIHRGPFLYRRQILLAPRSNPLVSHTRSNPQRGEVKSSTRRGQILLRQVKLL